jgi:hypothetical protein
VKRALATLSTLASLALAPTAAADPQNDYTVVRELPNGNEVVLAVYPITDWSLVQTVRSLALDGGRLQRLNNPAWVIWIYCPTDNPDGYTRDDICWGSNTDQ